MNCEKVSMMMDTDITEHEKNIEKLKECDERLKFRPDDACWLSEKGHLLYISGNYEDGGKIAYW